ncbi:hypothetical protein K437DRAFT_258178 [Tilletiaria anomala UBC 951]|uniref:Uncharacterized protein n=1 Tax=Tilletiaria anomala (strain ATCC 24038 / CBS 436.72 / UBC 951) TaxID=1037660 RepID=A0A066VIX1_TILAU|nr:uncharacterized protein K437DRAFT_258178 [Tilletiaria anomala UBC 951]KDN41692.1 hypothetical protein K437DRAFT_258178 [Tilletiaria anomala UBC 951]
MAHGSHGFIVSKSWGSSHSNTCVNSRPRRLLLPPQSPTLCHPPSGVRSLVAGHQSHRSKFPTSTVHGAHPRCVQLEASALLFGQADCIPAWCGSIYVWN